ncbi:methyltransferase domain-containing protein [Sulfitobacter pseudonitzschiae]|uniref:Methyltransferase domain-containing protein n=1 Tax=Pseudosulfitobacter pseudonitzschiae TaxID=1402135 RepID=A0A9Q2P3R6_9RHOB|nr:class I SAM-dependent methyltransferase [Pseudosulfitobacter pseudonitzschiae]MBM2293849.1 methyltransferase domain-containing protein [Pseudosulfitobacter pseudonitzschiae]MBM2298766.1 methyltransferase domain-containing protein [Pseudosulfitobacter pseudonitzschiae]MBM2303681.1 methyltransferase domain-containing protein [Pseudosulfitobacter pseudonitzschiae]MBM2313463.1 methyltransferase domain-containing protein [Pseudosulfitobacter pseudonitzschiae]MBM2318377.1 methyltransferase domain
MSDNSAQAEFWASESGRNWVRHQRGLDTIMAPVLDVVLEHAALQAGETVLDIGCGTGAATLRAAQAVGPQGAVHGYDISPVLLELAAKRNADLPQVTLTQADAQTHVFAKGAADALISRFGVMFFADTTAAFANLARALRPGGRMVMAAWGPAHLNPWFMDPARVARDRLGTPPKVDRTLPGPFAFEDADRVTRLLGAAGLDVTVTPVDLHLGALDTLDALADQSCHIGPAVGIMRDFNATDADRAAIRDGIAQAFSAYDTDTGVRVPARINLITARV